MKLDKDISGKATPITPGLVMAAFRKAATEAVLENDRLGIATHGSVDGEIVERRLPEVSTDQTS